MEKALFHPSDSHFNKYDVNKMDVSGLEYVKVYWVVSCNSSGEQIAYFKDQNDAFNFRAMKLNETIKIEEMKLQEEME